MKIHELKTDSEVFCAVIAKIKTFEIRKNDRDFKFGDYLHLRETLYTGKDMINGHKLEYTGREVLVKVIYILHGPIYGLADGWCIMSIRAVE